jgi:type VI protein secretion system component VasF
LEIDIEKLLQEVAKTPAKLEKAIWEIKKVRLESARKLRWWVILLVFCLGLVLGMVGTTFSMKSTEFACKLAGFGLEHNVEQGFIWCLSQIR